MINDDRGVGRRVKGNSDRSSSGGRKERFHKEDKKKGLSFCKSVPLTVCPRNVIVLSYFHLPSRPTLRGTPS